jgi:hypothetical protein
LMSSSTWLNHLVLGCPIFLMPLNFNYIFLLGIFGLSIPFTWANHCNNLSFNYAKKSWSPSSFKFSFKILSLLIYLFMVYFIMLSISKLYTVEW